VVRLRPASVSGLPRPWLNSRMPRAATHSPLVEPDVQVSRIRLSRRHLPQACAGSCAQSRSQHHQAHLPEVGREGHPCRGSKGSLAPPLQVLDHATLDVPVDRPEGHAGVPVAEVVRPALQVPVQVGTRAGRGQKARCGPVLARRFARRIAPTHARLATCQRAIPTVASFQVTRSARLGLALPRSQRPQRNPSYST
jgi:hypothetical protein